MTEEKESKTTYYGFGLLILFIATFIIIPGVSNDKIVHNLFFAVYAIFKLVLIFYGQTSIKKLNRNYNAWSVFLFFCTAISLIIIGQLSKLKKEISIIKLEPGKNSKNLNNFPDIVIGTDSSLLIEALQNDTFTLIHMISKYQDFIKENTSLFPILAAYELNKRDEMLKQEIMDSLDKFANEKGHNNFSYLLDSIARSTPEEINQIYK